MIAKACKTCNKEMSYYLRCGRRFTDAQMQMKRFCSVMCVNENRAYVRSFVRQAGFCKKCKRKMSAKGVMFCAPCAEKDSKNQVERIRDLKRRAIEALGGACFDCGLKSEYQCVFDFHHIDPSKKDRNINGLRSWSAVREEISKCMLLCANCHRIRTVKEGAGIKRRPRVRG